MKKSEAVELIAKTFEMEGLGTQMRIKDALSILDALEKAGMMPPKNPNKYDPVPTVTPTGNLDYSFIREWEEE